MAFLFFAFFVEVFVGDVEEGEFAGAFFLFFGADVLFAGAPDGEVELFDLFGEVELGREVVGFEEAFVVAFRLSVGAEGEGFVVFEFLLFFYELGRLVVGGCSDSG